MAFTQKDNSGAVFVNDRKEKDTHPDRTGTALIDGVEYFVNGWLKDGKHGPWLSLSFKRKDKQPERREPAPAELDDEIPF